MVRKKVSCKAERSQFLLSRPPTRVAESGFEDSTGSRLSREFFAMKYSYCCDNKRENDKYAVRHNTGRQHPDARLHSTYEKLVMGRGSSSLVAAKTMETPRKVKELQDKAGNLVGKSVVESGGRE